MRTVARTLALDIGEYFKPIVGQRPWRARLGVGSFLTLEFGRKVKEDHHIRGEWHLWIYQANWSLLHDDRKLADSDSRQETIEVAVRRLEFFELRKVRFDSQRSVTEFAFGQFRLIVSPADYLPDPDEQDEYWLLFMPNNEVLTVGPGGIDVRPSDVVDVDPEPPAKPKRSIDFNL
jgi:hypothetical protein